MFCHSFGFQLKTDGRVLWLNCVLKYLTYSSQSLGWFDMVKYYVNYYKILLWDLLHTLARKNGEEMWERGAIQLSSPLNRVFLLCSCVRQVGKHIDIPWCDVKMMFWMRNIHHALNIIHLFMTGNLHVIFILFWLNMLCVL